MKVAVFSSKPYDRQFLKEANQSAGHELVFFDTQLASQTVRLAHGFDAVCVFVNDRLDARVLEELGLHGAKLIALRCAGFNNVDLNAAGRLGMTVARVPAYSPYSVAEHTVGMILSLNRKTHRAYTRVREGNLYLEGLLGFDLHRRTVGIIGTGKIGRVVAQILTGFGCRILANDLSPSPECISAGVSYLQLSELYSNSDIVTLHCPLTPDTHHLIDEKAIIQMKTGVMLINTSRGALINTRAVVKALKSGKVGYLGLDVYEEEADLFFEDLSNRVIQDDVFARLLTFPNVLITGHQAFFTRDALEAIARTTIENMSGFEKGAVPKENLVRSDYYVSKK
jgi:D-lactate dehydrogenase